MNEQPRMNEQPHTDERPYAGTQAYAYNGQTFSQAAPHKEDMPMPEPPKKKNMFAAIDTLLAYLSILACFLLARALPVAWRPLGTFLCLLMLLSLAVFYLLHDKKRLPTALWCIVGYATLLSVGFLTGNNTPIRRWTVLIVLVSIAVLSCLCRGLAGKGKWSGDRLFFILCAVISTPILSFPHLFAALAARHGEKRRGVWRAIGWCALGLAAAAIPCVIIVSVLSYDAQFTALLDRIFTFRIDGLGEWIGDAFLGMILAILFFGVLYGAKRREASKRPDAPDKKAPNLHVFPRALICAFVTPILAIYAIFFVSQWGYYVSAFTHTLPEGLTFSEYARDGFFQLCGVSAFNAIMLFHVHLLMRRRREGRDHLRSVYTVLISLFTLVLIATALSKMVLYIDSYGLTQKRVYASWFMILLALIFLLTVLAQFIKRLRLAVAIPICCALLFALIALPNVDGMIANYNVDAYLDGRLSDVDVYTVEQFGLSGIPALIELEETLQAKDTLTEKEEQVLKTASDMLDRFTLAVSMTEEELSPVFSFNIPTNRAQRLLKARSAADK